MQGEREYAADSAIWEAAEAVLAGRAGDWDSVAQEIPPEQRPLLQELRSIAAVIAACNQKSNRDPVTSLTETEVVEALDRLRQDVLTWRSEGARAEEIIRKVVEIARTGRIGDGKIFVMDMEECVRIRTQERGKEAIG